MKEKIRAAIMGGSECGKTSLATGLSLGLWKRYRLRTLAFDPWLRESPRRWGPHAWATEDFDKFERVVFGVKNCAVFWDEGSTTGGRERENVRFFTAIRHDHPAFFFLGHEFTAMLPIMRASLTDLFLFRTDADDADKWARKFTDRDILRACDLSQYVALHKRAFRPVKLVQPSLAELRAGVLP